jgi:hypothetical protein
MSSINVRTKAGIAQVRFLSWLLIGAAFLFLLWALYKGPFAGRWDEPYNAEDAARVLTAMMCAVAGTVARSEASILERLLAIEENIEELKRQRGLTPS